MSKANRAIVLLVLAGAVVAVLALKSRRQEPALPPAPTEVEISSAVEHEAYPAIPAEVPESAPLPRLVDLGADKCIPCKMMAPILEELKKDFAGTFAVEFIDVWKNSEAGEQYGIRIIPTQIFYDRSGKELFRHEGFFGKDEILAKWKEFGITTQPEE